MLYRTRLNSQRPLFNNTILAMASPLVLARWKQFAPAEVLFNSPDFLIIQLHWEKINKFFSDLAMLLTYLVLLFVVLNF